MFGGDVNEIVDVEGMRKHAPTRGLGGHTPPMKFKNMNALKVNLGHSGGIFYTFQSTTSTEVVFYSKDSNMLNHHVGVLDLLENCRKSHNKGIFLQTLILLNIRLATPLWNATVERSFSYM